jgi:glycosyltransferase involved in cell wall biosynthesis
VQSFPSANSPKFDQTERSETVVPASGDVTKLQCIKGLGKQLTVGESPSDNVQSALLMGGIRAADGRSMLRYEAELGKALRSNSVSGWGFKNFGANPTNLTTNLYRIIGQRAATALVRYIEYPIRASRLKADVFHVLDHAYAHLLLGLDSRRSIVTCHDVIPLLISRGVLDIPMASHVGWSFLFRMRLMRRAAYVICDSESTRRDVIKYLGVKPDRVVTIAVGISQAFRPRRDSERISQLTKRLHLQSQKKVVLTVSGNSEYKNIQSIIRAIHILRQRGLNVVFLRVGGDFSPSEKQLLQDLRLDGSVRYVGSPDSDEDLVDFYQLAHVFAFPSLYEGFGWPPLEAMRCGTPVVASNAGSLPEVLGDAALFVDPRNPVGLADALGSVMQNTSLHAEMAARGLKRAAIYTWDRAADQTRSLYQRVVQEATLPKHT